MKIFDNIERYIETRTDRIYNTFRDKEKIKRILKDSINSGDIKSLNALSKEFGVIASEISDIYKLIKKIDDKHQDDLDKITNQN